MGSFTLGKYLPLNSCIHKLDPRAKIIAMLIVLIAIFIPAGWLGYGLIALAVISLIFMAKLSLKFVIKAMKPMLFMMVFLLVINILVVKSGTIILSIGSFVIYTDAIIQTLYIVVRLVLMIMITTALTATTKPLDLTLGIEDLLKPFARFKVPSHEIAMLISIALRFIPTFLDEAQRIMKAQASRGVDFSRGGLFKKMKAVISLIIPLFISAFEKSQQLSDAMEARGYDPNSKRSKYRKLKFHLKDLFSAIFVFALVGFVMYLSIAHGNIDIINFVFGVKVGF